MSDLEIIKLIEQKLTEAYGLSLVFGSHGLSDNLQASLGVIGLYKEGLQ